MRWKRCCRDREPWATFLGGDLELHVFEDIIDFGGGVASNTLQFRKLFGFEIIKLYVIIKLPQ